MLRNAPTGVGNPVVSYTYNPDNSLSTVAATDMLGTYSATTNAYDAAGRLVEVTTPSGEVWTHTYADNGWLLSTSSPSVSSSYNYNSRGFLTELDNYTNSGFTSSAPSIQSSRPGSGRSVFGKSVFGSHMRSHIAGTGSQTLASSYVMSGQDASNNPLGYDAVGNRLGFAATVPSVCTMGADGNPVPITPDRSYTSTFKYDTAGHQFAN